MKKIPYVVVLLSMVSLPLISCFGSDDDSNSNGSDNSNTTQIVVDGSWKVTLFQEDNSNQTNHFTGYGFTFSTNGTLVAVNGSMTQTGTWSNGNDDSTNKLIIAFPAVPNDDPFEEISEDWQIVSKSASKIELRHESGGDGSIDLLTFEKI